MLLTTKERAKVAREVEASHEAVSDPNSATKPLALRETKVSPKAKAMAKVTLKLQARLCSRTHG